MSRRQRRTRQKQARHAPRRVAATGGLALTVSLISGSVAQAATTLHVESDADTQTQATCGVGDGCTLRDALTNAGDGDTIVFNSSLSGTTGNTIYLSADLPTFSAGDLTIDGSGAPGLRIDTLYSYRIFDFDTAGTVAISDLTLYRGSGDGGAVDSTGTGALQISSMGIGYTQGSGNAGAVYSKGPLTVTGCRFYSNLHDAGDYISGGAVTAEGALTISGSSFTGNSASYGGAVYATGDGAVMIDNTTFDSNVAATAGENPRGGAIFIDDATAPVAITGSAIFRNAATVTAGTAKAYGGGISVNDVDSAVTIANSTIFNNNAYSQNGRTYGAGLSIDSANMPVTITGSTIANNYSYAYHDHAYGGGVFTGGSFSPQIQDSAVVANVATTYDGGSSGPDLYGSFTTSFSLIGSRDDATIVSSDHDLPDGTDPQFNPFGAGGKTLNPKPTSPLVDAGKSFGLTNDQRGETRPFDTTVANAPGGDGSDIGAVELQPADGVTAAPPGGSGGGGLAAPIVTAIAPSSGGSGTPVAITGENFAQTTKVLFGSTPATFTVDDFDHITAVAPAGLTGTVDITVVNAGGTSATTAADRFTYASSAGPTPGGPVPPSPPRLEFRDLIRFGKNRDRKLHSLSLHGIVIHATCDPGTCEIVTTLRQGGHVVGQATKALKKGENIAVRTRLSDSGLNWLQMHPEGRDTGHLRLAVVLIDGTNTLRRVGKYTFTR